jgi:hypothetical protein
LHQARANLDAALDLVEKEADKINALLISNVIVVDMDGL